MKVFEFRYLNIYIIPLESFKEADFAPLGLKRG